MASLPSSIAVDASRVRPFALENTLWRYVQYDWRFACIDCLVISQYWPTHSLQCERNISLHANNDDTMDVGSSYPFPNTVTLGTRSAVAPPVSLDSAHLPVPITFGCPYDYTVNAMYAKHDDGEYTHLYSH